MKILKRREFLSIEGQAVFAKYTPMSCGELCIKVGNFGTNDFLTQSLSPESAIDSEGTNEWIEQLANAENDSSLEIATDFDYAGRDGMFDEDQCFAVYSRDDVKSLIARLMKAL